MSPAFNVVVAGVTLIVVNTGSVVLPVELTVAVEVLLISLEEAVIVIGPPAAIAVNKPSLSIVPIDVLELVQVKVGWVVRALPNWSSAVAVNCMVSPMFNVVVVGVMLIVVRTGSAVLLLAKNEYVRLLLPSKLSVSPTFGWPESVAV